MKKKLRLLQISAEVMAQFLSAPVEAGISQRGFPADGRVVGCEWKEPRIVELTIESEEFEPVADGSRPPFLVIYLDKVTH